MSTPALFADTLPIRATNDDPSLMPDRARSLYAQASVSMLGHFLGIVVFSGIMRSLAPPLLLWTWALASTIVWLGRMSLIWQFGRKQFQSAQDYQPWLTYWSVGVSLSAVIWGIGTLVLYPYAETFQRVALMLMLYTYGMGAVPTVGLQPWVFFTCLTMYFLPILIAILTHPASHYLELAGIWGLMLIGTASLGRVFHKVFEDMLRLKVYTEELAGQLKSEMAVAETAQRQAELANRAKTQFFAAASHDLRQPLHAMGLFAEALRQRSQDEEVVHLVNSINNSVDALEGLFSELLDITRIDTGGVEPEPEHFPISDLFARLRLHFEPTAFEKGLSLHFRGEQHFAYADAMIVERILRNLLSNSIRYTEDGGILVSCRRRQDKLCIQVWDTGIGIAEKEQVRIFDEFYQVQSLRPLQPHQRKGLGLGLTIVKRLADLMSASLTMRSRVNRGTTFTLMLPIGKAPRWTTSLPLHNKGPIGLTLDRRLILVVEDEPAVLEGLHVLLKGWGATVEPFDTITALQVWLQTAQRKPDLMIVDYRLPEQRTGIEAVHLVREGLGNDIPAIMVTGSSMIGYEDEARKHDFHVLLKPVVPNKLRALIAFKLGMRGTA